MTLRPDGLGIVPFGAHPDEALSTLEDVIGPVGSDSGWIRKSGASECPGEEIRVLSWGGFSALFGDGATPHGQAETRHFFAYVQSCCEDILGRRADPIDLVTDEGMGVSATVSALRDAVGEELEVQPESSGASTFVISYADRGDLRGTLTGPTEMDRITSFIAGVPCRP